MPQKLKIAYTTCFLDVSGVTKINHDILLRLKQKGHEIHVISSEGVSNWDYMFELYINKPMYLDFISRKKRLEIFTRYLADNNIDLIYNTHSYWVYENLQYIKTMLPGIKTVDSLHVLEPYHFRGGYPDISANQYVHPLMDKSILISQHLKSYMTENYDVKAEKLRVIRNGIDTRRFKKNEESEDNFKKELGLEHDNHLIGFIGRLSDQKRPLMFLKIAKKIANADDNIFFYMIGSGNLDGKVRNYIKKEGLTSRVFLYDQRSDIENVLNSTETLLVPSSYEGAPLTILEAISTETHVIASNVGAIKEYVGGICELVDRSDEETEINTFVDKSLEQNYDDYTLESGANHIKENYDIETTAQKYAAEFIQVLSQ